MKENEKQSKALYILYIDRYYIYDDMITVDAKEYIYRGVFPTFLAKKSYGWWLTRRRMEI